MAAIDYDCPRGPEWKLDVFLSFRGEELRNSFASHLFSALEKADIDCYRDDDVREMGEKIHPKLVAGIRTSRFSLALFSRRYGGSRWCLNELVEMLDFHEKNKHRGHVFVPIFYKVGAGDVRKLRGKFGRCFEEYCKEIGADELQIETWKRALREAGSTTGWRLNGRSEAEFIDSIVDHLSNNMYRPSSLYVPEDVVPIESQVEEVRSLLKVGTGQCELQPRVVGIHGNRGMGKTTLVGMVSDRVRFDFGGFSFLQLEDAANRDSLVNLQRQLLRDAFKITSPQFCDLRCNANEIKRKLRHTKLLLILDNVTSKDQIKHFGVDEQGRWLSPGSRVIITTRYRQMLEDLCVHEKYEVKKMCRSDSLRLFSRRVFESDHPEEGFKELCESILNICNLRPSDLVDLASILRGLVKERWSEGIEKWRKRRKVFCRDLVERVLSEQPVLHSRCRGLDVAYPSNDLARMAFLSNPIRHFLENVNDHRIGFATLLISLEGQLLTIPLSNSGAFINDLLESQVPSFKPGKDSEDWTAEKTERRNDRSNNKRAWITLLMKMGILEPRRERTNQASPSRFTEYVGDQSDIPEPATDPNQKPENVLDSTDSPPEAESTSTPATNHEYIPRAQPSSNNARRQLYYGSVTPSNPMYPDQPIAPDFCSGIHFKARKIAREGRGQLPRDSPPSRSYGDHSRPFLLSQIRQASSVWDSRREFRNRDCDDIVESAVLNN